MQFYYVHKLAPISEADLQAMMSVYAKHEQLQIETRNTGCEAKVDLMAELACNVGHVVAKIWIRPSPGAGSHLIVDLNEADTERMLWSYHVAMIFNVGDAQQASPMVLDPVFYNEAVSPELWRERVGRISNGRNWPLSVVDSEWEYFYSADDYRSNTYRQDVLKRRDEILANANNRDDPVVRAGCFMQLRGIFADDLMRSSPDNFQVLKQWLIRHHYQSWYYASETCEYLKQQLTQNESYFGVDCKTIMNELDIDDYFSPASLRIRFWRVVGEAMVKLQRASQALLNGYDDKSMHFKTLVGEVARDLEDRWFEPTANELWSRFGVDL